MGIPYGSLHHADAGHHDCAVHPKQTASKTGTEYKHAAQCAKRHAQQAGTKTGGLRKVYGDNIMPTQLALNHNPRARREAADPTEVSEFGIASIAGLPARIPNRSGQMGTHFFFENSLDKAKV